MLALGGVLAQRAHNAHMTRRNWGFLLQFAIFSMNGVLMQGTKEETSSQRSCEGP